MGVKGLWALLEPVGRPVKLESLGNKELAIDASIWLHQFLKAMRDKEGNGLKNAHILGFFRRICKLLFYHIKPVFVFDGGVPALKRQTCLERKLRRKQNAKNLKKTAQKILAMQMRLRAIKETDPKSSLNEIDCVPKQPIITDDTVYFDELKLTAQEIHGRRKRDEYELPPIEGGVGAMVKKDDFRFANEEDLRSFIKEFKVKYGASFSIIYCRTATM